MVVAALATAWIAVVTQDPVVEENYYGSGIEINKQLARDRAMLPALQALGETVRVGPLGLKANAIEFAGGTWIGAADPRSEGVGMDVSGSVTQIKRRANDLNGAHE